MIKSEYKYNPRFRRFVDEYCREHGVTTREALEREEVKREFWRYTEV